MLSVHSVLNENCPSGHRWKSFASYPQLCESDEQDTIIHIMIYLKSNPLLFHFWYLNYNTIKRVLARLFLQIVLLFSSNAVDPISLLTCPHPVLWFSQNTAFFPPFPVLA